MKKTLSLIEDSAKKAGTSISSYVAGIVKSKVQPQYPEGFETLFGSVKDETFVVPEELDSEMDSERVSL